MKVLIAFPERKTNTNPFAYTLKDGLENIGCDVSMGLDEFWKYSDKYDLIHIHWPDSLVEKWNPTDVEVIFLQKHIEEIKTKAVIIYTRHDIVPHYCNSINKLKCYDIVEKNADAIVHLGNYGIPELKEKLQNKRVSHFVIPHHIYDSVYDNSITQQKARMKLSIPQNKFVVLTFGEYRDAEEAHMVLSGFKEYKNRKKYLLAPRLRNLFIVKVKSRFSWKWIKNKLVIGKLKLAGINMGRDFVSNDYLPYYFAAADLVLIQRKVVLNSGNIPMAFLFKKPVIGANIGNMGELLTETNNVVFDPNKKGALANAFSEAEKKLNQGIGNSNYNYAIQFMNINSIAQQYLEVYQSTLKNK